MNSELGDFLRSMRARLGPQDVGLPLPADRRRVPGLRREEVAILASVSVEYYSRLERGKAKGVSDEVLASVSRALRLNSAEDRHLRNLIHQKSTMNGASQIPGNVTLQLQNLVDQFDNVPALLINQRLDIIGANSMGQILYQPLFDHFAAHKSVPNHARFAFCAPGAKDFYKDWDRIAGDAVAILRASVAANPDDTELVNLIGELTTESKEFVQLWLKQNVRLYEASTKNFFHPLVGSLTVNWDVFKVAREPGVSLVTYSALRTSPDWDKLCIMASWAKNAEEAEIDSAPRS